MPILRAVRHTVQELWAVVSALTPTHRHLRERLGAVLVVTVGVDLLGSVAMLFTERGAAGSQIHGFGDALFWTTCQLLTVSSQLPNPVTAAGRVVDVVLEVYAITVVATLAGSFSAFFHRRSLERHPYLPPATAD